MLRTFKQITIVKKTDILKTLFQYISKGHFAGKRVKKDIIKFSLSIYYFHKHQINDVFFMCFSVKEKETMGTRSHTPFTSVQNKINDHLLV